MLRRISLSVSGLLLTLAAGCSDSGDNGGMNPPTGPALSINDRPVDEGMTATFTVTLNPAASADVIYHYETVDGSAVAGQDYTAVSGQDTILAGSTTATIPVSTLDDVEGEASETFSVVLSSPVNASIADGSGIATIAESDGGPPVSFAGQIRPLVANRCAIAGCHGSGSVSGGMTFGNATYTEVRNAAGDHGSIIVAGSASSSNMYLKTTTNPPFGARMPANGAFLSVEQQNLIRDWINDGAKDN